MSTDFYKIRGYEIYSSTNTPTDGVAQFEYKGWQVSFSTRGRSEGA